MCFVPKSRLSCRSSPRFVTPTACVPAARDRAPLCPVARCPSPVFPGRTQHTVPLLATGARPRRRAVPSAETQPGTCMVSGDRAVDLASLMVWARPWPQWRACRGGETFVGRVTLPHGPAGEGLSAWGMCHPGASRGEDEPPCPAAPQPPLAHVCPSVQALSSAGIWNKLLIFPCDGL